MRCRSSLRVLMCCTLVVLASAAASAAVKLPAMIGDNMVLQRGQPVPIWGWADKGEEVTVTVAGQKQVAKAGDDGRWKVKLDKLTVGLAARNDGQRLIRQCDHRQEHPGRRGLGLLRPVEHANGPRRRQRRRERDRRREVPANPAVHCRNGESGAAGHGCERQLEALFSASRWHRHLERILGDGLSLRASIAQRIESADRPDQHFLWRHAGRVLDEPQSLGGESRTEAVGPGRIVVPVQRHDRPADSLRHPRRDLVSGRIERAPCLPVPHAVSRDDRQLAGRLGAGRFSLRFRANCPVPVITSDWNIDPAYCAELWESPTADARSRCPTPAWSSRPTSAIYERHSSEEQAGGRSAAGPMGVGESLRKESSSIPARSTSRWRSKETRSASSSITAAAAWRLATTSRLRDFTIAGADQKFVPAVATIDGDSIVVHSDKVAKPEAVRFAWRDDATPNLANKEGLPASPFRTDQWKGVTEGTVKGRTEFIPFLWSAASRRTPYNSLFSATISGESLHRP